MIGVVLAAHGSLPQTLVESVGMILGEPPQVATVSLMPGDSLEGLIDRLRAAVAEVNQGEGVLILLDMFGGTPANAAAFLTQQIDGLHAVTGVNLPMLLEMFMMRESSPGVVALTETAFSAGQAGIVNVVEAFKAFRSGQ
jgi:mannose/fructose/sorbose-specific phosphotransferase system IIA component